MKKLLLIIFVTLTSCVNPIVEPNDTYKLDEIGGGVYYIIRSDKYIKFSVEGKVYGAYPNNYEIYNITSGDPYCKTSDFVNFKLFITK
jgi:hypothetical protein